MHAWVGQRSSRAFWLEPMAADSASSVSSVGFQVVRRTPVSLTNLLFSSHDITSGEPDIWGTVVAARSRETPRTPPGYIRQSYRDGYDSDDNDSLGTVTHHMLIPDPEHPVDSKRFASGTPSR